MSATKFYTHTKQQEKLYFNTNDYQEYFLGTSTSWNPEGLSRRVMRLLTFAPNKDLFRIRTGTSESSELIINLPSLHLSSSPHTVIRLTFCCYWMTSREQVLVTVGCWLNWEGEHPVINIGRYSYCRPNWCGWIHTSAEWPDTPIRNCFCNKLITCFSCIQTHLWSVRKRVNWSNGLIDLTAELI